jgi:serine protease Do
MNERRDGISRGASSRAISALVLAMALVMLFVVALPAQAGIFGETDGTGEGVPYITLPDFTVLAKELKPAVVNISTTMVVGTGIPPGYSPFEGSPFDEFFGPFFEGFPESYETQSLGSGFIISGDGFILTNNHVVENATEITVTLEEGDTYTATVIGTDPKTDLALIKIEAGKTLPSVILGDSDDLEVGEWVIAIGNPFGLSETVTAGIVSAKGRVIGSGPYDDFIQTDASINPGNSGGPLFNIEGEVVGINTAIINQGQGIGFAIPVNMAKDLLPQLKKGKVVRGWLGVVIQEITPELAESFGLPETDGALISDIEPGSPADKAGLKKGDVILKFNGEVITEMKDLPAIVAMTPVGARATITVFRDGAMKDITVVIGEMPDETTLGSEPSTPGGGTETENADVGISVEEVTPEISQYLGLPDTDGVLISQVESGSFAERAGILRGDVIREINHKKITSLADFEREMKEAQKMGRYLFLIWRNGTTVFIAINT